MSLTNSNPRIAKYINKAIWLVGSDSFAKYLACKTCGKYFKVNKESIKIVAKINYLLKTSFPTLCLSLDNALNCCNDPSFMYYNNKKDFFTIEVNIKDILDKKKFYLGLICGDIEK